MGTKKRLSLTDPEYIGIGLPKDEIIKALQEELISTQKEVESLKEESAFIQKEWTFSNIKLRELKEVYNSTFNELQKVSKENESLKKELKDLKEENERLKGDHKRNEWIYKDAESHVSDLIEEKKKLKEKEGKFAEWASRFQWVYSYTENKWWNKNG
jgi:chromosome segregation ATPase